MTSLKLTRWTLKTYTKTDSLKRWQITPFLMCILLLAFVTLCCHVLHNSINHMCRCQREKILTFQNSRSRLRFGEEMERDHSNVNLTDGSSDVFVLVFFSPWKFYTCFLPVDVSGRWIYIYIIYIYIQWGPTATKPEMLVFETPKTGLLRVSLRTHNHMLSTQLYHECRHTHTHRERAHGCKAWFLAKRSILFWTCCVQCRRNTARHTRQHSQCLDHDCACGNGIQTNILGVSLTWKPAMRFGAWI